MSKKILSKLLSFFFFYFVFMFFFCRNRQVGWAGLPLVVDKTGGLGPSQTQRREAFGSALARPSALSLCSLTSLLHHSSQVCHQQHQSLF